MTRTQDDIDKVAQRTRDAGVPDELNRWLGMTPEKLAETEAKIRRHVAADNRRSNTMPRTKGPKEQALATLRDGEAPAGASAPTKAAKRPASKKAAQTQARTPVQDKGDKTPSAGRPAEKQVLIKKLLAKKNGCTAKEVMEACSWPSVSMPQQAKALGVDLHKKKVEGEPTRYADHPLT